MKRRTLMNVCLLGCGLAVGLTAMSVLRDTVYTTRERLAPAAAMPSLKYHENVATAYDRPEIEQEPKEEQKQPWWHTLLHILSQFLLFVGGPLARHMLMFLLMIGLTVLGVPGSC